MYLKHLSLTNYRNYTRLERDLPPQVVLVRGDNAQGKTNLLEAIYYLATTRSPIIGADRHLLNWTSLQEEPMPFARLAGDVARQEGDRRVEITLVREGAASAEAPSDGRLNRRCRVNGVDKRAIDLLGQLNVVLFLPQDIDLVAGAPAGRRRYLDVTLCQVDATYCRHLQQYNRALTQRNSLLRRLRERHDDPAQLAYWDLQLARWGALVIQRRRQAVQGLERSAAAVQPALTGGAEHLALHYLASPAIGNGTGPEDAPAAEPAEGEWLSADPDQPPLPMLDAFMQALERSRPRDIGAGVSTTGPHRDELRFFANGVDMGLFGSRGQQRTVALALKLAEARFMSAETGEEPVLLLDDVMSELDRARGQFLLQTITGVTQVIITATDLSLYPQTFLQQAVQWQVQQGAICDAPRSS